MGSQADLLRRCAHAARLLLQATAAWAPATSPAAGQTRTHRPLGRARACCQTRWRTPCALCTLLPRCSLAARGARMWLVGFHSGAAGVRVHGQGSRATEPLVELVLCSQRSAKTACTAPCARPLPGRAGGPERSSDETAAQGSTACACGLHHVQLRDYDRAGWRSSALMEALQALLALPSGRPRLHSALRLPFLLAADFLCVQGARLPAAAQSRSSSDGGDSLEALARGWPCPEADPFERAGQLGGARLLARYIGACNMQASRAPRDAPCCTRPGHRIMPEQGCSRLCTRSQPVRACRVGCGWQWPCSWSGRQICHACLTGPPCWTCPLQG